MYRILGLALLVSAGAANAADQFDLLCTGTMKSVGDLRSERIVRRYRVNLSTNQYCYDECPVRDITKVAPGAITFEQTKAAFRGDHESLDFVNRNTGAWVFFDSVIESQGAGHCEPAPFSGFPPQPTKF